MLSIVRRYTQKRTAVSVLLREIAQEKHRLTSFKGLSTKEFPTRHKGYIAKEASTVDKLLLYKPLDDSNEKKYLDQDEDFEGRPEPYNEEEFLPSGDPDPRFKIGKTLLSLGKIHYRHSEVLPEWFLERQNEICQYRTNPQIRRCLKDWMIKHDRDLLEKYREKSLQWGHKMSTKEKPLELKLYGPEETIAYANYFMPSRFGLMYRVLTELQRLAPDFVPRRTVDFGCGPATAAAAVSEVWGEQAQRYTGVDISQSMLEAAKIVTRQRIRDCTFYSSNSEVMKRAAITGERFDLAVSSFTLSELPNDPSKRIATQMLFELLDVGGYLVILEPGNPIGSHTVRTGRQYVLDIFNNVTRGGRTSADMVSSTFFDSETSGNQLPAQFAKVPSLVKNKGDSSTGATERHHQVDMMLPAPGTAGFGYDQLGASVVAPCTHDRACPMQTGTWCSFSQKVYSGVIRKSSEEKFSYVIIQKRPKPGVSAPEGGSSSTGNRARNVGAVKEALPASFGQWLDRSPAPSPSAPAGEEVHPSPLAVLERFLDAPDEEAPQIVDQLIDEVDWDEYKPPLHREEWGRIIRSPIKSKGHITLDVCTPEGRLVRNTVSRSNLHQIPSLYTAMRKTTWGGLFPVLAGGSGQSSVARSSKGSQFRDNRSSVAATSSNSEAFNFEEDEETGQMRRVASRTRVSRASGEKAGKEAQSQQMRDSAYNMFETDHEQPVRPSRKTAPESGRSSGTDSVRTEEVVAASRSANYRRLLEAREAREAAEKASADAVKSSGRRSAAGRGGRGGQAQVKVEAPEEQQQAGRRRRTDMLGGSLRRIREQRKQSEGDDEE